MFIYLVCSKRRRYFTPENKIKNKININNVLTCFTSKELIMILYQIYFLLISFAS